MIARGGLPKPIGTFAGIFFILLGLLFIIKPDNFILRHLRYGRYSMKTVTEKYDSKTAKKIGRFFGVFCIIMGIVFLLAS